MRAGPKRVAKSSPWCLQSSRVLFISTMPRMHLPPMTLYFIICTKGWRWLRPRGEGARRALSYLSEALEELVRHSIAADVHEERFAQRLKALDEAAHHVALVAPVDLELVESESLGDGFMSGALRQHVPARPEQVSEAEANGARKAGNAGYRLGGHRWRRGRRREVTRCKQSLCCWGRLGQWRRSQGGVGSV